MPDFGIFRGFNAKLFGEKLYAGQLPTQLGLIGSEDFGYLYLLDDYPNASAAYSLRLLRKAYNGSAIRVRRASDNTEQDIGFVNNVLDTSTLTSFCSGTNGFVKTWYDQSGNGRDATQTTAANQPQIVSSGSVILDNGKPSLSFDSDNFILSSGIATFNSTYSTFDITSVADIINSGRAIIGGINGSFYTLYFNNLYRVLRTQQAEIIVDTTGRNANEQYLNSVFTKNTGNSIYKNSNLIISNTVNGNFSQPITRIGVSLTASEPYIGKMQEIIIYASDQLSNRTGIETNINNFYSIY